MLKGKSLKGILMVTAFTLTVTLFSGCGGSKSTGVKESKKIMKIGTSTGTTDYRYTSLKKFKEEVESKSKGTIEVQLYPSAQLGNDKDLIEGVKLGTVQATVTSAGNFGDYEPKMGISALPFIFKNSQEAWEFLKTPQVKKIEEGLLKSNIRVISYFENGFRCITNSKRAINVPADVKGLTIRTPENPYLMETLKALGANPSPLGFSDVYVALQQKTFDGQENPIPLIYNTKFYEVQKYLSITNHCYDAMPFVISETFYKSLTKEEQAIVNEAAIMAQDDDRNEIVKQTNDCIQKLKDKGMTITTPDLSKFKEATKDVAKNKFSSIFTQEELDFSLNYSK